MSSSLVSIIIPTFNRSHIISDTLDSVIKQTYNNWECIIVDDGSTDNTKEILQKYVEKDSRFNYYDRPKSKLKGANACRNYGFERSRGVYIIFFDSDDLMAKYCLENRVKLLSENIDYDFIVFSMGCFNSLNDLHIDEKRVVFKGTHNEAISAFILGQKLPWQVSRPIFRRSVIQDVSFNENLARLQDIEFNLKILICKEPKFKTIDITDSYYRLDHKKYETSSFINTFFKTLFVFYFSIIQVLKDKSMLNSFINDIKLNFFKLTIAYYKKGVDFLIFKKIIILLFKNKVVSFKNAVQLFFIGFLKKYWFMKKGYYTLIKKLHP